MRIIYIFRHQVYFLAGDGSGKEAKTVVLQAGYAELLYVTYVNDRKEEGRGEGRSCSFSPLFLCKSNEVSLFTMLFI